MERERAIIGSLLLLQLILWLGFFVHRAPRFPGSPAGGFLAVSGALLMIVPPILYSAAKRSEFFKKIIKERISLGALLSWHVYTSVVGSILAILHTGHRFESNLGVWLTAAMLMTVFSGFVGRYYLRYASMELLDKRDLLNRLATEYNRIVGETPPAAGVDFATPRRSLRSAVNGLIASDIILGREKDTRPHRRAVRLAESIADLEYAIGTHEILKRRAARWLTVHIATSGVFYLFLLLHVWSAVHFGLRWFD